MKTGTLQHKWSKDTPVAYDKNERIVRFDIRPQKGFDMDEKEVDGFSFVEVQIDKLIDYGHIKSQLIEAGYAQKDEFGLLMNAVGDLAKAISSSSTYDEMKGAVNTTDVNKFMEFLKFRELCAAAAKMVVEAYAPKA